MSNDPLASNNPPVNVAAPASLAGWVPSHMLWRDGEPVIQWALLGEERLLDPFFEQTLQRVMRRPFQQLFRRETTVDEVLAWTAICQRLPLRGVIFHMSRCGSTLISQMLAAVPHHVVASEPAPLDLLLRAPLHRPGLPLGTHLAWIRAMVAALGQPRTGTEDAFFLKLDCWHVHQVDLLRAAFPEVPFLFLYRDPIEVMVSHAHMPASWTVPGIVHPLVLQLKPEDWDPQHPERYCARALAHICDGGLQAAARCDALLVNYTELPQAMYNRVFAHFGLALGDLPAMLNHSHRDAKSPGQRFESDSAAKQAAATPNLRAATAKFLQPVYDRLEAARVRQLAIDSPTP